MIPINKVAMKIVTYPPSLNLVMLAIKKLTSIVKYKVIIGTIKYHLILFIIK